MSWNDETAREHVSRTEALLAGLDDLADAPAGDQAAQALQAVVALYGECLARVMGHADGALAGALAADELVGHLLLVHDLHPDPVEIRVRRGLAAAGEGGVEAELIAVEGAVARVRVRARGCGSAGSAESARQAVRDAVCWAAPEIERVEAEADGGPAPTLIPVDSLFRAGGVTAAASGGPR
ncbi:NifU family protein [Streptomyces sp. NPDC049577]|uniref:NifU family protein n=1 Tax=Streptomyces sp. NPDC049577 TaxID=3155153 RepID=UPI0034298561